MPAPVAPAAPPASRMTLASVHKGTRPAPDRILLYGTEGIGKSTFGANAPNPIFIAAEDGIRQLDVASFPEPKDWNEVIDAVRTLQTEPHGYKTVVFDTLDWIEPIICDHVCRENRWANIEAPGYGKGWVPVANEWRRFLAELDRLRASRQTQIILLAHAQIKPFINPAGTDYARYELKLQKTSAALVKEWTDVNLFAIHEEVVTEVKGKSKGVSTGRRIIHTTRTAAWDAKTRYGLPATMPLSWEDYSKHRSAGVVAPVADLYAEAVALLDRVSEETRKVAAPYIEANKTKPTELTQTINRLRVLADQKGE